MLDHRDQEQQEPPLEVGQQVQRRRQQQPQPNPLPERLELVQQRLLERLPLPEWQRQQVQQPVQQERC